MEVNVRKLILATASVLALGIGGAGVSLAADTHNPGSNAGTDMPAMSGSSQHAQTAVNPSKDEIRQAQQQLRDKGLYNGMVDGIIGPETQQALEQFQRNNGLQVTAKLDEATMNKLLGNTGGGQGSSMPPGNNQPNPATPGATNSGDHTAPKQ